MALSNGGGTTARYVVLGFRGLLAETGLSKETFARKAKVSVKTVAQLTRYSASFGLGTATRIVETLSELLGKDAMPPGLIRRVNSGESLFRIIERYPDLRPRLERIADGNLNGLFERLQSVDSEVDAISERGGDVSIPTALIVQVLQEAAQENDEPVRNVEGSANPYGNHFS
jgi:hypothetical protein